MALVFPENYENLKDELKLSNSELNIVEFFKGFFKTEDSILLIKLKSFPNRESEVAISVIDKEIGVVFFKFISVAPQENFDAALKIIQENIYIPLKKSIKQKLASHRQLQLVNNKKKYLKIPFGLYFCIDNFSRDDFKTIATSSFKEKSIFFLDDFSEFVSNRENFISRITKTMERNDSDFSQLSEDDINAVLFQVTPEYTIPRYIEKPSELKEKNKIEPYSQEVIITGKENFVYSWRLDQEQIKLVNSLLDKHELILACAGSGKSVLLLSRAIKIAKILPDKKILVTFFNRALRTFYEWRFEVAGISANNLVCKNIHQLCHSLLIKNHIPIQPRGKDDEDYYSRLINETRDAVKKGTIKDRFFAIFIDEIQDFESDWYRLCIELLEDRENYILCVCGDVTQDIRGKVKKSSAPWQGQGLPSYRGRSRTLKKNYRNSYEINKYTEFFLYNCLDWIASNFDEENIHEDDFNIGDSDIKTGIHPMIHHVDRFKEAEKVVNIVKALNSEYDVPFSDIAVLYPFQKFQPYKYWIRYWLGEKFNENNITYSEVQNIDKEPSFYEYAHRRGVTFSAMDSIKGLDFLAIVICGLLPFRDKRCSVPEEIFINMKRIYTSMTRAIKHLHLLLTNSTQQDIITKMVVKAYEEYNQQK